MKRKFLIFLPSTWAYIKEGYHTQGYSLKNWLHGYIYSRWIYLYIGIGTGEHILARKFKPLAKFLCRFFKPSGKSESPETCISFSDTYHGKVISLDTAKEIVTVNRRIEVADLEQVIPYKLARSIILENPEHIVVMDCPCRKVRPKPCKPIDVCLVIGEIFSQFILEHHPANSRKINMNEAVEILEAEHKRGHVHHAFFKSDLFNRFYAICNCCSCCCGAIQAWRNGTPMLASSGYVSRGDDELCTACGVCVVFCQFEALKMEEGTIIIDEKRCLGCGVCVTKCKENARWLERDNSRGTPLGVNKLAL